MAIFGPFTNGMIKIDGTDLSDHFTNIALSYEAEEVDGTTFGDETRITEGGLKSWGVSATARQDFTSSSVDDTLFDLVGSSTITVEVRPNSTASVGSTNPRYHGTGCLLEYPPLSGDVGEDLTTEIRIAAAGTLSRSTTT